MATEKRLIDAYMLKDKLQEHHDFFVYGCGGFRYLTPKDKAKVDEIDNCIAEIVNAPTVDAVEVVHGRWNKHDWGGVSIKGFMVCSACNVMIPTADDARYCLHRLNYCPNCGAKMDGDEDEVG